MDIDGLFQKHTLPELKDVEKKLRTDVERKKEELRDLVSKRYRDLLVSADEIQGMHVAIKTVTEQLNVCRAAETNSFSHIRTGKSEVLRNTLGHFEDSNFFDRMLSMAPESIFQALDISDPLTGALLFAVVRNLVWQRSTENSEYKEDPRWSFIRVYPDFITRNIETQFEKITYEPMELSGYFAAHTVLNSSVTKLDTLRIFLAIRTSVIHCLLTTSSTLPIKETLRLLLICTLETIHGVQEVFGHSEDIREHLQQSSESLQREMATDMFHGKNVSWAFDGAISALSNDGSSNLEAAKSVLDDWLTNTVLAELSAHVPTVLNYVHSIQSVSEVSHAVIAAMREQPRITNVPHGDGTSKASMLKITALVHDRIRARFSSLVEERTSRILKEINEQLNFDPGDSNSNSSPADRKFRTALHSVGVTTERSSTRIKFAGIRPDSIAQPQSSHPGIIRIAAELTALQNEITQTERAKDDVSTSWMQEYAMKAFSDMITAFLPLLQERLQPVSQPHQHHSIYKFFSELARQNIFGLADTIPGLTDLVHRQLDSCISLVFGDWLTKSLERWKESTCTALNDSRALSTWSRDTPPFQCNTVEERNESDELVQYTVTVPCRASVTCHNMLHSVHDLLVNFTSDRRAVPTISDSATRQIFLAVAQCYSDHLQEEQSQKWTKNQALQLIFDLKVISTFGKRKKAWPPGTVQSLQKLMDKLADSVDPIDYHVLLPFLEKNVALYVATIQNLYFILTFAETSGAVTTHLPNSSDSLKSGTGPHLLQSNAVWFSSPSGITVPFS